MQGGFDDYHEFSDSTISGSRLWTNNHILDLDLVSAAVVRSVEIPLRPDCSVSSVLAAITIACKDSSLRINRENEEIGEIVAERCEALWKNPSGKSTEWLSVSCRLGVSKSCRPLILSREDGSVCNSSVRFCDRILSVRFLAPLTPIEHSDGWTSFVFPHNADDEIAQQRSNARSESFIKDLRRCLTSAQVLVSFVEGWLYAEYKEGAAVEELWGSVCPEPGNMSSLNEEVVQVHLDHQFIKCLVARAQANAQELAVEMLRPVRNEVYRVEQEVQALHGMLNPVKQGQANTNSLIPLVGKFPPVEEDSAEKELSDYTGPWQNGGKTIVLQRKEKRIMKDEGSQASLAISQGTKLKRAIQIAMEAIAEEQEQLSEGRTKKHLHHENTYLEELEAHRRRLVEQVIPPEVSKLGAGRESEYVLLQQACLLQNSLGTLEVTQTKMKFLPRFSKFGFKHDEWNFKDIQSIQLELIMMKTNVGIIFKSNGQVWRLWFTGGVYEGMFPAFLFLRELWQMACEIKKPASKDVDLPLNKQVSSMNVTVDYDVFSEKQQNIEQT